VSTRPGVTVGYAPPGVEGSLPCDLDFAARGCCSSRAAFVAALRLLVGRGLPMISAASAGKNPAVAISFPTIRVNYHWLIGNTNKPNRGRFHYTVASKPTRARIRLEVGITKYPSAQQDVSSDRTFVRSAPYAAKINCRMPCSLSIMAQAWPKDSYPKPWRGKITLKVWID